MPEYRVIQCPHCGFYQATASELSLKCKYCNKATTITSKKGHARVNILAASASAQQAAEFVRAANQNKRK